MKLKPLGDRLVVQRVKEKDTTEGGIVIPDAAKEKSIEGVVMAVGPGRTLDDGTVKQIPVKVGDRVLFGKYGGAEVTIGGEQVVLLREDDVYGVLE